jgi:hypothetical protein
VLTSLPITLGTTADTAAAGNDSRITGALQRSGGTMTGKITLDADPSSNLHAATKQYVDGQDFGIGQTWQDVSGSRVGGTTYQNTTGKPIEVSVEGSGTNVQFQVSSNGSSWLRLGIIVGSVNDFRQGAYVVPPNWYYRLSASITIVTWMELR